MINFKQFLTESRSAPLFHATNIDSLYSIMKSGIQPRTSHSSFKLLKGRKTQEPITGISCSRSFEFAKDWSGWKTIARFYSPGVILELDQRKLAQRYEIKPIQYWITAIGGKIHGKTRVGPANEYEEFIITKNPIPFSYVNRVYFLTKGVKTEIGEIDIMNELRQKYGSEFIRVVND